MDPVALSMVLSTVDMQVANTQARAQASLFKKVVQSQEDMMATLLDSLPPANPPGTGVKLDYYA